MRHGTVAITVLSTLAVGLLGAPSPEVQQGLMLGALAIGLPHGATDHLGFGAVERRTFQGLYLLGVAGFAALWWALPPVALALFVLASAWHFGEADLRHAVCAPGWHLALWGSRGVLVLAILAVAHGDAVAAWLVPLGGAPALEPRLTWFIATAALTAHVLAALQGTDPTTTDGVLVESGVLAAWVWVAPPLMAFALYFAAWHSLPQLRAQLDEGRAGGMAGLLRAALPHTLGGMLMIGASHAWLSRHTPLPSVSILLAVLGCLSMPHVAIEAWRRLPARDAAAPVRPLHG